MSTSYLITLIFSTVHQHISSMTSPSHLNNIAPVCNRHSIIAHSLLFHIGEILGNCSGDIIPVYKTIGLSVGFRHYIKSTILSLPSLLSRPLKREPHHPLYAMTCEDCYLCSSLQWCDRMYIRLGLYFPVQCRLEAYKGSNLRASTVHSFLLLTYPAK